MKKLVIVGCGRLADIVADAVVNGLLPEYDLTGVYSRTASKAERIVTKMRKTYAKKRKYGSQNSLFSIYISHFLSENYRF